MVAFAMHRKTTSRGAARSIRAARVWRLGQILNFTRSLGRDAPHRAARRGATSERATDRGAM